MNIYRAHRSVFHFDLYRIESQEELEELGLWEHLLDDQALRLVEWPERASGLENSADIHVHLSIQNKMRKAQVIYFNIP